MEAVSKHPLLIVTEEEVLSIRKSYNLDSKKIQENLEIVMDWWKKQDHLVEALQYTGPHLIERVLLLAKGSVERTKMMIDKILTTKGLLPELVVFHSFDEFETLLDNILYTTLPRLNPLDTTRITLFKIMNENFDDMKILTIMRFGIFIADVRSRHEYSFHDRQVIDLKNVKANMLSKIDPMLLKKAEFLCTEAYKLKIKGIHLINAPPFVDLLIRLLKQVLNKKLAGRIYLHRTYEDLYQEIPKEILPKDYGGDQPSCQMLAEQWKNYFKTEEAKEIIERSSKLVSNESKRSSFKFNEEYLGTPGSFKQINVD